MNKNRSIQKITRRSIAEFKGIYKRGSESILASPHFTDVRTRYMRNRLESNFFGPKEWHLLTRDKMRQKSAKQIASLSQSVKRKFISGRTRVLMCS